MKILAVCNNKGGVGKTTIANLIAIYAAQKNIRTLLVDLDPQGNSSLLLAPEETKEGKLHGILKVLGCMFNEGCTEDVTDVIMKSLIGVEPNLYLLSNDIRSSSIELRLSAIEAPFFLKKFYRAFEHFRLVILDTPPHLTGFTACALFGATHILIPVDPHPFSAMGLTTLLSYIREIQEASNDRLMITGVLVNRYRSRIKENVASLEYYQRNYADLLFPYTLPDTKTLDVCLRMRAIKPQYLRSFHKRIINTLDEILRRTGL